MFKFLKKLFGCKVDDQITDAVTAPYKIEAPTAPTSSFKDVEVAPIKVKLVQPGQRSQGAKKPAQGKKPQGQKPAGQKKPAQPKQGAGNKPRGRRPKAKPATPQQ